MVIYALLTVFAIVFFELVVLLRMSEDAKTIVTLSQQSMHILASSEIGDAERENFMRRGAAAIFKATCRLALKFLLIGLILYLLFLLLPPELSNGMGESLISLTAIGVSTVTTVCYACVRVYIRARRDPK